MTVTFDADPVKTRCDLCQSRMAAVHGPRNKHNRPAPPDGYELGYIVELRDRTHTICAPCLVKVLPDND